jgi:hypothetical protein
MKLAILESPYAGDLKQNLAYARAAIRHSLSRGEAPLASHLLYAASGALDDDIAEQRALGIAAGQAWLAAVETVVVYADLGISPGMRAGIEAAKALGKPVVYRTIGWPP